MDANIGNRVKTIRRYYKLTQSEFCEKLGISRDALNNIENVRLKNVPDNTLRLISVTYDIDYFWLTTGEGEMLHESDNPVSDKIDELLEGENDTAKAVFRAFANFSEDDWKTVQKFIDNLNSSHVN